MSGTDPQGDRPLPADLPQIPGITLQYEVARGGMGVVYGGRQDFLDRRVAVKLLSRELGGEQFAQRFQREAKILAGIKHQNIVSCHMAGTTDDGQSYLVMEFIDGPSLKSWITKHGAVSCAAALRTTRGVAQALAHAHMLGVIHRDVKPENILLETVTSTAIDINFPFTPKLVDLGLARMTAESAGMGLTSPGSVMGTPSTMSPEQFDDPDSVDFRTDIYGLGCALYEMLVGKPAFRSSKLTDIVMAKRSDMAPDPCAENATIPAAVGALVQSMLATRREDRPASYKELDEQVAALLKVMSSSGSPTRTMTDLGGATVVTASPGATMPSPSPKSQAPKAPSQPSGPGLLRTAEIDFLSAGAQARSGDTGPQFVSGVAAAGGVPTAITQPPKPGNRKAMIAAAAVVVLGGIAWAVFGRSGRGGDEPIVNPGPKPTPDPVAAALLPVISEIKGLSEVDLGKPFTLQAVAKVTDPDGGTLSYSWTIPPQIVFLRYSNTPEVSLRIEDGLPGVPFEIAVDVTDAKMHKARQVHTVKVGACKSKRPLEGFDTRSEWKASSPSWTTLFKSTVVSCRAAKSMQTLQGPLEGGDYWEWSGMLQSLDTEESYAQVYVRFEFGNSGWAIHCTRDKAKADTPWLIEVLEANRSSTGPWGYRPFKDAPQYTWFESKGADGQPTDDEFGGWFSVQRRDADLTLTIGEIRRPADGGKDDIKTKGSVTVPFTGDGKDARVTLVVDQGIGHFDLRSL